jgi:hypothetical protein
LDDFGVKPSHPPVPGTSMTSSTNAMSKAASCSSAIAHPPNGPTSSVILSWRPPVSIAWSTWLTWSSSPAPVFEPKIGTTRYRRRLSFQLPDQPPSSPSLASRQVRRWYRIAECTRYVVAACTWYTYRRMLTRAYDDWGLAARLVIFAEDITRRSRLKRRDPSGSTWPVEGTGAESACQRLGLPVWRS